MSIGDQFAPLCLRLLFVYLAASLSLLTWAPRRPSPQRAICGFLLASSLPGVVPLIQAQQTEARSWRSEPSDSAAQPSGSKSHVLVRRGRPDQKGPTSSRRPGPSTRSSSHLEGMDVEENNGQRPKRNRQALSPQDKPTEITQHAVFGKRTRSVATDPRLRKSYQHIVNELQPRPDKQFRSQRLDQPQKAVHAPEEVPTPRYSSFRGDLIRLRQLHQQQLLQSAPAQTLSDGDPPPHVKLLHAVDNAHAADKHVKQLETSFHLPFPDSHATSDDRFKDFLHRHDQALRWRDAA